MQIFGLHKNIYIAAHISLSNEINEKQASQRQEVLGHWELLKKKGLSEEEIQKITGFSRSTYYRRKKRLKIYGLHGLNNRSKRPKKTRHSTVGQEVVNLVLTLRKENPTYGKQKIRHLLLRDYQISYSESTIGRILRRLMEEGKIKKYSALTKIRKRRKFNNFAQRWKYGMKAQNPGELIQIDHMSVHKNGMNLKHFQAWDPTSKVIVADVYTNANSTSASKFLTKVLAEMPFDIKSIQVDGGSEFMKEFEQNCEQKGIPLFVLPPKRPQWNGGVERANRTFREDLYASENFIPGSIMEVKSQLSKAQLKYNSYRPHQRLDGLTPFQYVNQFKEAFPVSHVMN